MEVVSHNRFKSSNSEKTEELLETSEVAQSYRPIKFTLLISFVFLVAGLITIIVTSSTSEKSVRYDDFGDCMETDWKTPQSCAVPVSFPDDFEGEMHVYFEIRNFYQNLHSYASSRSLDQLQGETINQIRLDDCEPIVTIGDLGRVLERNIDEIANPCGLIAKTVFNDTFALVDSNHQPVDIHRENIDWGNTFQTNEEEFHWTDVEDEGFGVWMKTSALPRVLKLWGRVHNIQHGDYFLHVESRYDVREFKGEKYVVFVTCNFFGGSHLILGVSYLAFAVVLTCFSAFFAIRIKQNKNKVHTDMTIS